METQGTLGMFVWLSTCQNEKKSSVICMIVTKIMKYKWGYSCAMACSASQAEPGPLSRSVSTQACWAELMRTISFCCWKVFVLQKSQFALFMLHNGSLSVLAQPPACPAGDEASHRNISEQWIAAQRRLRSASRGSCPVRSTKSCRRPEDLFSPLFTVFPGFFFFFLKPKMLRVDESILHNF